MAALGPGAPAPLQPGDLVFQALRKHSLGRWRHVTAWLARRCSAYAHDANTLRLWARGSMLMYDFPTIYILTVETSRPEFGEFFTDEVHGLKLLDVRTHNIICDCLYDFPEFCLGYREGSSTSFCCWLFIFFYKNSASSRGLEMTLSG
jgi:hypothetical protein